MLKIRPIHPFPARMAPSIVWNKLPNSKNRIRVLDPMAGSGTTLVTARARGHDAIGFDRDPLAVLIAGAWCADVDEQFVRKKTADVLTRAKAKFEKIGRDEAFPDSATDETKQFIRYWFDETNRRQLTALANTIARVRDHAVKQLLWCAFSRLIITKKIGVSLAMDVSHSRPHKKYDQAPIRAFDSFSKAMNTVLGAAPFKGGPKKRGTAEIQFGDARMLPLDDETVDLVITSPPYLNAIDYLRGHKLSLVWMGHQIDDVRTLRSTNIGAEVSNIDLIADETIAATLQKMCDLERVSNRTQGMLAQYAKDIRDILKEIERVLVKDGKAVFVVGNSTLRGNFISNSSALTFLAKKIGLSLVSTRTRPLPENRRYLPPPTSALSGNQLQSRMREEVIITFVKS
jgi:DNA modification methylase